MAGKRQRQQAWLEAYLDYGTQSSACQATGESMKIVGRWREEPRFRAALQDVKAAIADNLEEEAIKRARSGSDNLLMFLLKGHRPDKFRDRVDTRNVHAMDDELKNLISNIKPSVGPPNKREEGEDGA